MTSQTFLMLASLLSTSSSSRAHSSYHSFPSHMANPPAYNVFISPCTERRSQIYSDATDYLTETLKFSILFTSRLLCFRLICLFHHIVRMLLTGSCRRFFPCTHFGYGFSTMKLAVGLADYEEGCHTGCHSKKSQRVQVGERKAGKNDGRCKSKAELSAL